MTRRHDETPRVVGIIVMHSMNHKMQLLSPTSLRFVMEKYR